MCWSKGLGPLEELEHPARFPNEFAAFERLTTA
jgi:hypothetical protein